MCYLASLFFFFSIRFRVDYYCRRSSKYQYIPNDGIPIISVFFFFRFWLLSIAPSSSHTRDYCIRRWILLVHILLPDTRAKEENNPIFVYDYWQLYYTVHTFRVYLFCIFTSASRQYHHCIVSNTSARSGFFNFQ